MSYIREPQKPASAIELENPTAEEIFGPGPWQSNSMREGDAELSPAMEIADREIVRLLVETLFESPQPENGKSQSPAPAEQELGGYACVRMADVAPEKVKWLWKPYLPIGKITLLDGWPGIGKSWLTCELAAIVTRGGGFPNGVAFEPGNVLIFSAEDGLNDTLRPRLDACGADVNKVIALNFLEKDGLAVFDQKGLLRFEATIAEYEPLLVIVDPLFAFTGGAVDIHRANECREVSRALAAIAARQQCNILCVRHLNKSGGYGSPMKAGIGSIDWLAAARVGLLAGCDPDDESKRALTNYKNNLAPLGASLGYRITFDPGADVGSFEWTGESNLTAERILAPAHHEDSDEAEQRQDAEGFLRELLADGEVASTEVEQAFKAAGISDYARRQAKTRLRVRVRAEKQGGEFKGGRVRWFWSLPTEDVEMPTEDVEKSHRRHLLSNGGDKSSYSNGLTEDVDSNSFQHLLHLPSTPFARCADMAAGNGFHVPQEVWPSDYKAPWDLEDFGDSWDSGAGEDANILDAIDR